MKWSGGIIYKHWTAVLHSTSFTASGVVCEGWAVNSQHAQKLAPFEAKSKIGDSSLRALHWMSQEQAKINKYKEKGRWSATLSKRKDTKRNIFPKLSTFNFFPPAASQITLTVLKTMAPCHQQQTGTMEMVDGINSILLRRHVFEYEEHYVTMQLPSHLWACMCPFVYQYILSITTLA